MDYSKLSKISDSKFDDLWSKKKELSSEILRRGNESIRNALGSLNDKVDFEVNQEPNHNGLWLQSFTFKDNVKTHKEAKEISEKVQEALKNAGIFNSFENFGRGFHEKYKGNEPVENLVLYLGLSCDEETFNLVKDLKIAEFSSQCEKIKNDAAESGITFEYKFTR